MMFTKSFRAVFDDPPVGDPPVGDPPVGDPPTEKEKEKEKEKGQLFNQDQVNKLLADQKRKDQKNREELLKQLTDLKDNSTLTEKQKNDLELRIEQVQSETATAQELAKKDRDKLQKEWEGKERKLTTEINYWRNLYSSEKIDRDILDAAIEHEAIYASQIKDILKPNSKMVEILNKEGKPTGVWETRITLQDEKENGEAVLLDLPATEAVKRMSEMPKHGNLFRSGANGGLGGFNVLGSNKLKGSKPPQDHKQYQVWAKENIPGRK